MMKILEILPDEQTVVTDCGTATFYPVKKIKRNHCKFCWLYQTENCRDVKCGFFENQKRKDNLVGVFSIREMPMCSVFIDKNSRIAHENEQKTIKKRTWTIAEEQYLYNNLNEIPFSELCIALSRSERAVSLHLHQKQRGKKKYISDDRNILLKALNIRFINYRWFRPTRDFYERIGSTQKRFQAILKGQCKMTNEELMKMNDILCLSNDELLEVRQLNLFAE